ncbi:MAG: dihydrodipicolinate synthase family protein [Chloroflexota bacterium]
MGYKTSWFKGIFPALVTPFDANNRLDETAYRRLIQHLLPDVNGLVPSGTTGEFSYLSAKERIRTIEIAVEEAGDRVPVAAGTGATSTKEAIELTEAAKSVGASAALVVAPYYLKPNFNEVYDHFRALDKIGLPLILYNLPQCAGTHFRWWTAEGMLLDLENVIGIKDTSGDMAFFAALMEKVRDKVSIFVGHDEVALAAFSMGADGAILASANLIPDVWQRIISAVQSNDLESAREDQQLIQKLVRIVTRTAGPQAVKQGLTAMGLPMGDARYPIMPGGGFKREDFEELRLQLETTGVDKIHKREITYSINGVDYPTLTFALPDTPREIAGWDLRVGEGFAGPPFEELAHVDLLIGKVKGPVGRAIDTSMAGWGSERGLRLMRQRPQVLLVPTVTLRTAKAKRLFYDHAARGVEHAIDQSIQDGFLPETILDEIAIIANVFVHPSASIAMRVFGNNAKATRHAIRKAIENRPSVSEIVTEKDSARHPFRYSP